MSKSSIAKRLLSHCTNTLFTNCPVHFGPPFQIHTQIKSGKSNVTAWSIPHMREKNAFFCLSHCVSTALDCNVTYFPPNQSLFSVNLSNPYFA